MLFRSTTEPPKYLVFFKGKDADVIAQAFKEFVKVNEKKQQVNKSLLLLSKIENGQFTDTVQVEVNKLLRQYLEDYKEVYQYREIITSIEEEGVFYLTINETLAVGKCLKLVKKTRVQVGYP